MCVCVVRISVYVCYSVCYGVHYVGDKVYSINGQSITRCSLEQVQRMLLMRYGICHTS